MDESVSSGDQKRILVENNTARTVWKGLDNLKF
jgi:hypothetical protein